MRGGRLMPGREVAEAVVHALLVLGALVRARVCGQAEREGDKGRKTSEHGVDRVRGGSAGGRSAESISVRAFCITDAARGNHQADEMPRGRAAIRPDKAAIIPTPRWRECAEPDNVRVQQDQEVLAMVAERELRKSTLVFPLPCPLPRARCTSTRTVKPLASTSWLDIF
jgi:hypothetical protein